MKKISFRTLLIFAALAALVPAGCSSSGESKNDGDQEVWEEAENEAVESTDLLEAEPDETYEEAADAAEEIPAEQELELEAEIEEEQTTDTRFERLAEQFAAELKELGAPGAALAIMEKGKITFKRGFGVKSFGSDRAVSADTLFRIGSVTKMLTTASLLQQVQAGKVELQKPAVTYIPAYHYNYDASWAPSVKVWNFLTHTSGLNDYLIVDGPSDDASLASFLTGETYANRGYMMAPAGVMYNYSNPNFMLAGLVTETVCGASYRMCLKQGIFDKMDMTRTFMLPADAINDGDVSDGYCNQLCPQTETVGIDSYDNAWARPAGYAISSVSDLAAFGNFLMKGDAQVLNDDIRAEMTSAQINTKEYLDVVSYGYGLMIYKGIFLGNGFYETKILTHGGAISGYSAELWAVPSADFVFVTLANSDGAYFRKSLAYALLNFAQMPEPSTPPDDTVNTSDFNKFAGDYIDKFNVGTITITKENDELHILMPDVDSAHIPYDKKLEPICPDNFVLTIQGQRIQVTFIYDEAKKVKYFRTRAFVGEKKSTSAKTFHQRPFKVNLDAAAMFEASTAYKKNAFFFGRSQKEK